MIKIEYRTPPGAGAYSVLADETAAGDATSPHITEFAPAYSKQPQVTAMFQAAAKQIADIGNGSWTLAFKIERVHASQAAAAGWASSQASIFGGVATLDVKVTAGATVLTLSNCAVTAVRPEPISDLTSIIRYEFIGQSYS